MLVTQQFLMSTYLLASCRAVKNRNVFKLNVPGMGLPIPLGSADEAHPSIHTAPLRLCPASQLGLRAEKNKGFCDQ